MNKISIIMAAYNSYKTIGASIESVINQTYENWELIIVNDKSTDDTLSVISNYAMDKRIRVINNDINLGASISRKIALEAASSQWIAILDSDDLWQPNKLEKQLNLAKETGAKLIFTGSSFVDCNNNNFDWILHVPAQISYKQLLKQNLISNSSILVDRILFSENYVCDDMLHEDFATWLQITKSGVIAYGLDEALLIYRISKSSKSGNKLKAAKMNWHTYRYIGLNVFSAMYYMVFYTIKGLIKYNHLR